ncbi:MAG: hypothetical protein U9R42_01450 [Bacteroidota bacterium]|nr:hypothetical protein [Bacteroidota bacterium]
MTNKTIDQIKTICKKVGTKLIHMYNQGSSEQLIFPNYRTGNIRISEQEARFLFANEITKQTKLHYAIEVPTQNRYSDFSTKPIVYDENTKGGRSGAIDLSLYNKNTDPIPVANIEFKNGQPKQSSITKDLLKLAYEPQEIGVFFHILENSNKNTIDSLLNKINNSILKITKYKNDQFYLFIVILKKKTCFEYLANFNNNKIGGNDLIPII